MLRIEMLPAANGDALWIEYGDQQDPRRILVDGGTKGSWDEGLRARIDALPPERRQFELLVVTHVDSDHIDGALALLGDDTLGTTFGDVWFNGWRHLPDTLEPLGPVDGELLTDAIVHRGHPWNEAFDGEAVAVPAEGELPRAELADGLEVTVLGPGLDELVELKPVWREVVEAAGLDPDVPRPEPEEEPLPPGLEHLGTEPDVAALATSVFKQDTAEANGSSIVLLLEHEGVSALLTGDAFPSVVLAGVNRLLAERDVTRLALDAFKTPHHGSRANLSPALLAAVDCGRHLFSSSGAHTRHPHPEAVARTLVAAGRGSTLFFNYSTLFNEPWADSELKSLHGYDAIYPAAGAAGVSVTLGDD